MRLAVGQPLQPGLAEWAGAPVRRESSFLSLPPEWEYSNRSFTAVSRQSSQSSDCSSLVEVRLLKMDMNLVARKIKEYNSRIQLEAFHVSQVEEGSGQYKGALRIYMDHEGHNYTKAVKLDNSMTCAQLLPTLWDKFNIPEDQRGEGQLYMKSGDESVLLKSHDHPLAHAVASTMVPRFILRLPTSNQRTEKANSSSRGAGFANIVKKLITKKGPGKAYSKNGDFTVGASAKRTLSGTGADNQQTIFSKPTKSTLAAKLNAMPRTTTPGTSPGKPHMHKSLENIHRINLPSAAQECAAGTQTVDRRARKVKKSAASPLVNGDGGAAYASGMNSVDAQPEYLEVHGASQLLGGKSSVFVPVRGGTTVCQLVRTCLESIALIGGSPLGGHSVNAEDCYVVDAIGREEEGLWFEDYAREMGSKERPLMAMTVMRPSEGFVRRFELRSRLRKRSVSRNSEGSLRSAKSSVSDDRIKFRGDRGRKPSDETTSSHSASGFQGLLKFPKHCPYLLTVDAYDHFNDVIFHLLDDDVVSVGSGPGAGQENQTPQDRDAVCDIGLSAPDVLSQHAWLSHNDKVQSPSGSNGIEAGEGKATMSITAVTGAYVAVNGHTVVGSENVHHGDTICIGKHYTFLFKDPAAYVKRVADASDKKECDWLTEEEKATLSLIKEWQKERCEQYEREGEDSLRYKFCYRHDKEDAALAKIMSSVDPVACGKQGHGDWYQLTPAFMICLCLDYSAAKQGVAATQNLLVKVGSLIQSCTHDQVKLLAENNLDSTVLSSHKCMVQLLPRLHPVLFWLSNALELNNYIQKHSADLLPDAPEFSQTVPEVAGVLANSVTFSFQQTIYYITKILYPALESLLTSNPFSQSSAASAEQEQVEDLLFSLDVILQACVSMGLPVQVTSQLFSYLYFFMGTSLFNLLMEPGVGKLYYCWEQGVKIRKNFEILENWASDNGLDEANKFLEKAITVADFLATRKQTLLQADWSSLRQLFPRLNNIQTLTLLQGYRLGPGRAFPDCWRPGMHADGREITMETIGGSVEETYEDHPPLVLPNDTIVDIRAPVTSQGSQHFADCYAGLVRAFEDDSDSGFHMGRASPMSPTSSDDARQQAGCTATTDSSPTGQAAGKVTKTEASNHLATPQGHSGPVAKPRMGSSSSTTSSQRSTHSTNREAALDNDSLGGCSSLDQACSSASSSGRGRAQRAGGLGAASLLSSPHRTLMDLSKLSFEDIPADVEDNDDDQLAASPLNGNNNSMEAGAAEAKILAQEDRPQMASPNERGFCSVNGGSAKTLQPSTDKLQLDIPTGPSMSVLMDSPTVPPAYHEALMEFFHGGTVNQGGLITVELTRGPRGLGLGLIDGLYTTLCETGIYVRQLIPNGPAQQCGKISIGDRLLAVEGHSLLGADYQSAMNIIKGADNKMRFLLKTGENQMAQTILAATAAAATASPASN